MFAAFFNFSRSFVFHLNVAATVGKGIVEPGVVDHYVVFGALIGAIAWNLVTWCYGLPSSSSHALIGGLVGAALAKSGAGSLVAPASARRCSFIFLSPLLGFLLGSLLMVAVSWICSGARRRLRVDRCSAGCSSSRPALYSLGHGGNDAQKTIGIIWMLLIATGHSRAAATRCRRSGSCWCATRRWRWARCSAAGASSRPWARRSPSCKPVGGFCAETGGALTLFLATALGIPVSTTHTITGAIVGVGSAQRAVAVRWGVAGNIVWAWILTIPCSAFIAGLAWWLARALLAS